MERYSYTPDTTNSSPAETGGLGDVADQLRAARLARQAAEAPAGAQTPSYADTAAAIAGAGRTWDARNAQEAATRAAENPTILMGPPPVPGVEAGVPAPVAPVAPNMNVPHQ